MKWSRPNWRRKLQALLLDEDTGVFGFHAQLFQWPMDSSWCGWHPDRHVRLFNRKKTRFTNAEVHEGVIADGLPGDRPCRAGIHYSYDSVADFLTKAQSYTDLYARQNRGIKSSSLTKAIRGRLPRF